MAIKTQEIRIEEYDYPLPDEKIARFPLAKRDESRLLLYNQGNISEDRFYNLTDYLPEGVLVVFNNTRVIRARLLFHKETGARIEIFCLEPAEPYDYALIFRQTERCRWICMVGNSKKWKEGVLSLRISIEDTQVELKAERISTSGDSHLIEFSWENSEYTFAELLEAAGILPIPPYLQRETEASDLDTYQTVYSRIKGSVAAPTAGLHFTPEVLEKLNKQGFERAELTLHVGAGTFKPVKSETLEEHAMHTEFISVNRKTIGQLLRHTGHVIAVGTTSVRTLESLYYIGIKLEEEPSASMESLSIDQWMPYRQDLPDITAEKALNNILDYLDRNGSEQLISSTQIMIAPGYTFHILRGIITNFHQPKSTLLLLISAFVKGNWKSIYEYALKNEFRFLSYGDSSLLL